MTTAVCTHDDDAPDADDRNGLYWPAKRVPKRNLGGEIRHRAWKELNKPEIAEHAFRVKADQARRAVEFQRVEVIEAQLANDVILPPFPGTVMFVSERRGKGVLARLKRAYLSGDIDTLHALGADIKRDVESRRGMSVGAAAQLLIESPLFYDLRYGGKTLVSQAALIHDVTIGSVTLPWNGGELDDSLFRVVNYRKDTEADVCEADHLIIKRKPLLNDLEKQALAAVPRESSELHIAEIVACPFVCGVGIVVTTVLYCLATLAGRQCFPNGKKLSEIKGLDKDLIDSLGPHATARELLVARRKVFEDYRS